MAMAACDAFERFSQVADFQETWQEHCAIRCD